jgi:hypothetical protein
MEDRVMETFLANDAGVVIAVLVTVGLPVALYYWFEYRKAELNASLKHAMIERGMSAEEIKMVLEAPSEEKEKDGKALGNSAVGNKSQKANAGH